MGMFDALINQHTDDALCKLVFTRRIEVPESLSDSDGKEEILTVAVLRGRVYRKRQNTNVDNAAVGSTDVETNAVSVKIDCGDNPEVESWVSEDGELIFQTGDVVTQPDLYPISHLTGSPGDVERVRPYGGGFQIDLRVGTERQPKPESSPQSGNADAEADAGSAPAQSQAAPPASSGGNWFI